MGSKHHSNFAESKLDASPSKSSAPTGRESDPIRARLISVARERHSLLVMALPMFEAKLTQAAVAPMLGISQASLSRLLNACAAKGNSGRKALAKCRRLVKLPVERLAPKVASGGRESDFEPLAKMPRIVRELKRLYACHRVAGHSQPASIRAALQDLGYSPLTPPLLARRLRVGTQPKPLVALLKRTVCVPLPAAKPDHSKN